VAKTFISIVSHGQARLANSLLGDLARHADDTTILVTSNISEPEPVRSDIPNVAVMLNTTVKGFGANHNAAFAHCDSPFFCVSNPDIRIPSGPFGRLEAAMAADPAIGLIAPVVTNPAGQPEDSARTFPTLITLGKKALGLGDGRISVTGDNPVAVDWVGGMFMVFRADAFTQIGGFDENFFLYYEDVDICARLWKKGWKVMVHPGAAVVHDAQRSSHYNLRYARFHGASLTRYLIKHTGRLPSIHR
jgi:N-acetylglucosaminyl-diphospho-decaprenol L-rhamnosyltransferase